VLGELRRGEIAPIYCLYGKERFLLGRVLDALRAAVLEPATKDFNHDVLDAKAGAPAIVAAARTLPMMAKRRLVVVRGADEIKADAAEPLLAYVADPAPETVLVLLCEKVDARQKLFATIKKKGALAAFDPPRDRELYSFIVAEARARGGGIEESAARLLAEIVGPDLGQLAQAVEKLVLYAASGGRGPDELSSAGRGASTPRLISARRISDEDVATCVAETRARSIFDLMNAVGQGDREAALRQVRRMLADRESPIGIVSMLARHFRQLAVTRELTQQRAGKGEIASALGLNPYFVDGLVAQARRYNPRALARALERICEADAALKSSRLDDGILLERLIGGLT